MSTISKALPTPPDNFSTQLAASVSSTDTTIQLDSTSGLPTEGVGQLFKKNADGEVVAGSVEFVHWTSVSGNSLVLSDVGDRGITGSDSGAQAYAADDYFEVWVSSYYNFRDAFDEEHNADGTHASTIVKTTATQTLTNKTLTSPTVNGDVSGEAVLDEDDMVSDSDTKLATQQSIKAYVDSKVVSNFNIYENSIINGGCEVAQRSAPNLSTSYQYGQVDRFAVKADGTVGAGTVTQTTSPLVTSATAKAIKVSGVTLTGLGALYLRYRMESRDATKLKNLATSFSLNVYHDQGSAVNYTITVNKANAVDDFSAVTQIATSGNLSVNNETSTEIKLEDINSGSLDDCSNGLEIIVKIDCGAVTNKNFEFSNIQLNKGATVAGFQPKFYSDELFSCRRYYIRYLASGNYDIFPGSIQTSVKSFVNYSLPVQMRIAPTLSHSTITGSAFTIVRSDAVANVSAMTLSAGNRPDGGSIVVDMASSTAGQSCFLRMADNNWIAFSAEL